MNFGNDIALLVLTSTFSSSENFTLCLFANDFFFRFQQKQEEQKKPLRNYENCFGKNILFLVFFNKSTRNLSEILSITCGQKVHTLVLNTFSSNENFTCYLFANDFFFLFQQKQSQQKAFLRTIERPQALLAVKKYSTCINKHIFFQQTFYSLLVCK